MKLVVDTNVLVSAFLKPSGLPGQILKHILDGRMTLAWSMRLRSELHGVVHRPKIVVLMVPTTTVAEVEQKINRLTLLAEDIPAITPTMNWVPQDQTDNWFIQCAVTAGANIIVSGDKHLRSLKQVGSIRILSPAKFLAETG